MRYKSGQIRLAFYLYRKAPENFVVCDFTVQQFAAFDGDAFMRFLSKLIAEKESAYRNWPQVPENTMKEGDIK